MTWVKILVEIFSWHILFKKINITMQRNHDIPIEMVKIKIQCWWGFHFWVPAHKKSKLRVLPSKGSLPNTHKSQRCFGEKKKLICEMPGKETEGKAQICLPSSGFKAGLRGLGTGSSWTTDPLLLKAFWSSGSSHVHVLWFCRGSS